jgi:hypothetical protein
MEFFFNIELRSSKILFSQIYDLCGSLHALLTVENIVIIRMLE